MVVNITACPTWLIVSRRDSPTLPVLINCTR